MPQATLAHVRWLQCQQVRAEGDQGVPLDAYFMQAMVANLFVAAFDFCWDLFI
jgi:hypothetical protein